MNEETKRRIKKFIYDNRYAIAVTGTVVAFQVTTMVAMYYAGKSNGEINIHVRALLRTKDGVTVPYTTENVSGVVL